MDVLKPLTKDVISHLRTGVTATSVSQCVEELVLNSVDAGAKCIAVRVDFSCWKIQVVDNGCGISVDQLEHIAERYNTSKCHIVEDLDNLKYFGYRGEALSSIRDASLVLEIVTRTKHSAQTFCRLFQKGQALKVGEAKTCRPSTGTTITAYELFYNLPVRRKCTNTGLEFEKIRQRVEGIALINPQISFSLRNDVTGNVVIQTHKSNNTLGAFTYLFGVNRARYLSETHLVFDPFEISGYISKEGYCKKDLQFLYINGRLVLKTKIHKIINKLLGKYCFGRKKYVQVSPGVRDASSPSVSSSPTKHVEKHGVFFLNIKCPFNSYDVTFDPAKTVVEFKDWETLVNKIEKLVRDFLKKEGIIISIDDKLKDEVVVDSNNSEESTHLVRENEVILLSDEQKYAKSISSFDVTNSLVSKTAQRIGFEKNEASDINSHLLSNAENGNSAEEHICSKDTMEGSTVNGNGRESVRQTSVSCKGDKLVSLSPLNDIDREKEFVTPSKNAPIPFSSDKRIENKESESESVDCTRNLKNVVSDASKGIEIHKESDKKIAEDVFNTEKSEISDDASHLSSSEISLTVVSETSLSDISTFVSSEALSSSTIKPLGCSTPLSDLTKSSMTHSASNFTDTSSSADSAVYFLSEDPLNIASSLHYSDESPLPSGKSNRSTNESMEMDSGLGGEHKGAINLSCLGVTSKLIALPRGETSILAQFRKRKYKDDLSFTRNSTDSISRRLNEIQGLSLSDQSTYKKPNLFINTKEPQNSSKDNMKIQQYSLKDNIKVQQNLSNDNMKVQQYSKCSNNVQQLVSKDNLQIQQNSSKDTTKVQQYSLKNNTKLQQYSSQHKMKVQQYSSKDNEASVTLPSLCSGCNGNTVSPGSDCFLRESADKRGTPISSKSNTTEICASLSTSIYNKMSDSKKPCVGFQDKLVNDHLKKQNCSCRMVSSEIGIASFADPNCYPGKRKADPEDPSSSRLCSNTNMEDVINHTEIRMSNDLYKKGNDGRTSDVPKRKENADTFSCVKKQEMHKFPRYSEVTSITATSDSKGITHNVRNNNLSGQTSELPQPLTRAAKLAKRMRGDKDCKHDQFRVLTSASFIQTPSSILKQFNPDTNSSMSSDTNPSVSSNTTIQPTDPKNTLPKKASDGLNFSDNNASFESRKDTEQLASVDGRNHLNCDSYTEHWDISNSTSSCLHKEIQQNFSPVKSFLPSEIAIELNSEEKTSSTMSTSKADCLEKQSASNVDLFNSSECVTSRSAFVGTPKYKVLQPNVSNSDDHSDIIEAYPLFNDCTNSCCKSTSLLEYSSELDNRGSEQPMNTSFKISDENTSSDKETQNFLTGSQGFQTDNLNQYDVSDTQADNNDTGSMEFSQSALPDSLIPPDSKSFENQLSMTSLSDSDLLLCIDSEVRTDTQPIDVPVEQSEELQNVDSTGCYNDSRRDADRTSSNGCSEKNDKNIPSRTTNDDHHPSKESSENTCPQQSYQKMDDKSGTKDLDSSNERESSDVKAWPPDDANNWVQMADLKTGEPFYIHKISGHTVPVQKWSNNENQEEVNKDDSPVRQLSKSFKSTFSHLSGKISKLDKHLSQASNSTFRSLLGSSSRFLLDFNSAQTNNSALPSDNTELSLNGKARDSGTEDMGSSNDPLLNLFSEKSDSFSEIGIKELTSCTPDTAVEESEVATNLIDIWENPVFNRPEPIADMVQDTCENTKSMEKTLRSMHPMKFTKDMLQNIQVVGQIDNKFIACLLSHKPVNSTSIEKVLVFIDQHAAHERIRLERLKKESFVNGDENERLRSSEVIPPESLSLPAEEVRIMHSYKDEFQRIGFDFKGKDRDSIQVTSIPACIVEREASEFRHRRESAVMEIVQTLIGEHVEVLMSTCGARQLLPKTIHRLLCSQACRGAIKFGDNLSLKECEELLQQLSACDMPFQCAHGRPSLIPILELKRLDDMSYKKKRIPPKLWKLKFS